MLFPRNGSIENPLLLWHSLTIDGFFVGSMTILVYKLLNYLLPLVETASAIEVVSQCDFQRVRDGLDKKGTPTHGLAAGSPALSDNSKSLRYRAPRSNPLSGVAFSQRFHSVARA